MRAELQPFGVVVSGPNNINFWVSDTATAEIKLVQYLQMAKSLEPTNTLSRDDFTITAVFAKAWSGNLDTLPTAPDWDTMYAGQILHDAAGVLEAAEQAGGAP